MPGPGPMPAPVPPAAFRGLGPMPPAAVVSPGPADADVFEWHEIKLEHADFARGPEVLAAAMHSLIMGLGASSPMDLEMRFPGFEPEIRCCTASGVEVEAHEFDALDESAFPVTFKIKLPKVSASAPELPKKPEEPTPAPAAGDPSEGAEATAAAAAAAEEEARQSAEKAEAHVRQGLEALLQMRDVTLVFTQPYPTKTQRFQHSGPSGEERWASFEVPGDFAEFEFSTDGDSGDRPEQRWGILGLVFPRDGETKIPSQEEVEAFFSKWVEFNMRSTVPKGLPPEVERNCWDEARLRSLCARFGWEFEWMAEDGERRRRAKERWDVLAVPKSAALTKPPDTAEPDDLVVAS